MLANQQNMLSLFTNAIGFWTDGNLIQSDKTPTINYGFVGDVKKVNTQLLETYSNNIVPYFLRHNTMAADNYYTMQTHCQ
jgi:acetylglutamate kinase